MSEQEPPKVGSAGRYQRSASGLVGAIIVVVVVVGAILGYRSLFSSETEIEPDDIDFLPVIARAQEEGFAPVYPARLPKDWIATTVDLEASEGTFGLSLLTDDEEYVGIRQSSDSLGTLLSTYVDDKEVDDADDLTVEDPESGLPTLWEGHQDRGGDTAYSAEVGDDTVLVFGSASPAQLREVVEELTTRPLR